MMMLPTASLTNWTQICLLAEEICIPPMDEKSIKTLRFPPHYLKAVHLQKPDHVTTFSDTAVILRYHRAHMSIPMHEVLYLRNTAQKVAAMKQVIHFRLFEAEDLVKEVWRHAKKILHQGIGKVYFTQKNAKLMGAG